MLFAVIAIPVWGMCDSHAMDDSASKHEYFEKHVRPLLAAHCYECHSKSENQGGLRVDSGSRLLKGGDSGEAIVPGNAEASLLMEAVRYESYEMPPEGKLPDSDIAILKKWIDEGAYSPEEKLEDSSVIEEFDLASRRSEHWVWQSIKNPELPSVQHKQWLKQPLDHFILAQLEQAELKPALPVDSQALIRRLYFDLIGLPPSSQDLQKYSKIVAEYGIAPLVDDLLASEHFGERWGRHWLDLVRYAESRGHEFDSTIPGAYFYRDYVIRAFNADVPYDQLIREHLAGDLLTNPRLHPGKSYNESILGTGFWFLGEWVHSPVDIRKDEADRFDNMVDVMSKTFLGMTVSCARCHDHKFDAISSEDYYALTGFLQSSDFQQVRFETLQHNKAIAQELASLNDQYQQHLSRLLKNKGLSSPQQKPQSYSHQESLVVDYSQLVEDDFLQHGMLFGHKPEAAGTLTVFQEEDQLKLAVSKATAAVSQTFWNEMKSIAQGGDRSSLAKLNRQGRTLRTPTFEVTNGQASCLVEGAGHVVAVVDSHRLIAGPLHGNTIVKINPKSRWVNLNLSRYVGHNVHLEFIPQDDAVLKVHLVAQGLEKQTRKQLLDEWSLRQDVWNEYQQQVDEVFEQESSNDIRELLTQWNIQRSELQKRIQKQSHVALAMSDGTGENDHLLIRGNASRPGKEVPRRFLSAINQNQTINQLGGSGRLELAEELNAPENPLTSRVIVNRIWHHLMGRGIVPTTDDFGVLGQRPTHPQLLDHLAIQFREQGQSLKQIIRYIVLSQTYQMSCEVDPEAAQKDPKNLKYHHHPLKRLEGEAIRDALLTLSGKLDRTQFGPSVPVHLTSFMEGRGRPGKSGPLDGNGRRSIYLEIRRNFLSPFMLTFDTPVPFSSMGRRNSSNVPAQALILMNDPFVIEQAHLWAQRIIAENSEDISRLHALYQTAFARNPTDKEQQTALAFLKQNASSQSAWNDLAHALINTKEFIFLK